MKIATIGTGNVGGGLAARWEAAGHDVHRIARDGGEVGAADVVLLAVPYAAIGDALRKADGVGGKPVIDATNTPSGERPDGFDSLAAYVKSITGGPVAKAFNTNFARLYGRIDEAASRPGCLYCGDDEIKAVTARLIEDAGYEPIDAGGLENARAVEDFLRVIFAVSQAAGQVFYRMAPPERF